MNETLAGRRILLVGGAGFIGHHLALEIKQRGGEACVVDSLAVNNLYSLKNNPDGLPNVERYLAIIQDRLDLLEEHDITLVQQDARDYHALGRIITDFRPDALVQLAAVAHAGKSNKDPYTTFDHSLRTLENSLDHAARSPMLGIKHFVYLSSSMVYGNFLNDSVTEETPCSPLGIYGALKLAGELLVKAYHQVFDLPYTIIRPSALYGERCVSRRVGQIFIENAMDGLEIAIDGGGHERLDFTYVADFVSGVVNVLTHPASINETFNLTYGSSRSIADMASILRAHFPDLRIKYLPKDKLMPSRGTLCVDRARSLIGYEPQHPLETGFVQYIEWYKSIWSRYGWNQTRRAA